MQTQNKTALVTGGSRGLGKNAALQIAKKGIDVIVTYNNKKEEAKNTVREIEKEGVKASTLQLNTGIVSSFSKFSEELQGILKAAGNEKIDFLINNAGFDSRALFKDTAEEQFDNLFNVHFKGVYFLTQTLLPLINDRGAIINFSTGLARFTLPGYSAYASMKGAIEVFTRYLAKELGARGIRANTVAPGAIETDFTKSNFDAHPEMKGIIASQTALGRVGLPDDIGGVIAFLCTEEARWINAQRLEISGGMFL
jgi:NAD(P)-dependent dehydrogenase (short-subunit alcohol dehydrogenase family)